MRIARARPAVARAQAGWIVAIEPWRGLGYAAAPLGRYLARMAKGKPGDVWIATAGSREKPLGVVVATDGFLLGGFIALLAVRPDAAGQGIGQALVARVAGARLRQAPLAVRVVRREQSRGVTFLPPARLRARRAAPRPGSTGARRAPAAQAGAAAGDGSAGPPAAGRHGEGGEITFTKVEAGPPEVGYHWGPS